ncbi:BrnA antitoxin family protein [Noviherbaspirillum pedocola]|uniref:BrnA antitoxin family protein n=1 Tax=Noviherbaspirillum pedocola TaxID=2801341 RepID=A0A934T3D7_9BURK|nr:BrnA antitoxin family protein [Noviherbaspirillum pedocola]MBK4739157.1 BrnA antitoxin family protein [Noviherbaspirillum pedocola]
MVALCTHERLCASKLKEAQPASNVLPHIVGKEVADVMLKRRGRKPGINNKVATNIRFDNDLLDTFKATGDGWQTRMNDALRDWEQQHRVATVGLIYTHVIPVVCYSRR